MMKQKIANLLFVVFLIGVVLTSCSKAKNEINISGKLAAFQGKVIHLALLNPRESYDLDSTILKEEGRFQFRLLGEQKDIYRLYVKGAPAITLIASPGDQIELTAKSPDFSDLKIDASPDQQAYVKIGNLYGNAILALDKQIKSYRKNLGNSGNRAFQSHLDAQMNIDTELLRKENTEFINKYPNSLLSVMALSQSFGRQKIFSIEKDSSLFFKVEDASLKLNPNNPHVIYLKKRLTTYRRNLLKAKLAKQRMQIGNKIPIVSLPLLDGEKIRIGDTAANNRLIYFWSSLESSSRKMNKELQKLFAENKNKAADLICISLDYTGDDWAMAVKNDGLPGIQASELQGESSVIAGIYDVPKQLPYFIEIDPNGIIIYKGIDFPIGFFKQ